MATPAFGFSVGDFIAAINVVFDVIKAVDDAAGAKRSYQRLDAELLSLTDAMHNLKSLHVDTTLAAQKHAIEQVVLQCLTCVVEFRQRHNKFAETLGESGQARLAMNLLTRPPTSWRMTWHKIEWALMKEKNVLSLRAELEAHKSTINMILGTIRWWATIPQLPPRSVTKNICQFCYTVHRRTPRRRQGDTRPRETNARPNVFSSTHHCSYGKD